MTSGPTGLLPAMTTLPQARTARPTDSYKQQPGPERRKSAALRLPVARKYCLVGDST